MPTFTPPTTDGNPVTDGSHPLWRHYGAWSTGLTVWKDESGVWHQALSPYLGGDTSTVHHGDTTTTTGPAPGLATAQVVYLGGHVHEITDAEATELTAAGYGDYIDP